VASNVKHAFVSGKSDDPDSSLVNPSNWNEAHEGAVEIEDRDLTQDEVVSSLVEESIYSHSIAGNVMGSTGGVRLTLGGDILKNVAGTVIIRVKLGATTILQSNALALTQGATRYEFILEVLLMNSATGAQKATGKFLCVTESSGASFSALLGNDPSATHMAGYGTASEDTTTAKTLDVTVQWSASDVNLSFRKEIALLELIPAA
jgi:hypothetical protein